MDPIPGTAVSLSFLIPLLESREFSVETIYPYQLDILYCFVRIGIHALTDYFPRPKLMSVCSDWPSIFHLVERSRTRR